MNPDGSIQNPGCNQPHNPPCTKKHCSWSHGWTGGKVAEWSAGVLVFIAASFVMSALGILIWNNWLFPKPLSPAIVKQRQDELQAHVAECAKFGEYWNENNQVCQKP